MSCYIVASRGESATAPENTAESFALARARRDWAVEGDFQITNDNAVICVHDTDNLHRTARCPRPAGDLTLTRIKKLDAGLWRGAEWRYVRIPTLDEVLDVLAPEQKLFLEFKSCGAILPAAKKVFDERGITKEKVIFLAGSEEAVIAVRRQFPGFDVLWISDLSERDRQFSPDELTDKLTILGVRGVSINDSRLNSPRYVRTLHNSGFVCYVWTVDDPDRAAELAEWGVDYVASTRAAALRYELKEMYNVEVE